MMTQAEESARLLEIGVAMSNRFFQGIRDAERVRMAHAARVASFGRKRAG